MRRAISYAIDRDAHGQGGAVRQRHSRRTRCSRRRCRSTTRTRRGSAVRPRARPSRRWPSPRVPQRVHHHAPDHARATPTRLSIAQIMQSELKPLGINAEDPAARPEHREHAPLQSLKYDMIAQALDDGHPRPGRAGRRSRSTPSGGSHSVFTNYDNPAGHRAEQAGARRRPTTPSGPQLYNQLQKQARRRRVHGLPLLLAVRLRDDATTCTASTSRRSATTTWRTSTSRVTSAGRWRRAPRRHRPAGSTIPTREEVARARPLRSSRSAAAARAGGLRRHDRRVLHGPPDARQPGADASSGARDPRAGRGAAARSRAWTSRCGSQYWLFLDRLLHGNLGTSLIYQRPVVRPGLSRPVPVTLSCWRYALVLALVISVPLAALAATAQGRGARPRRPGRSRCSAWACRSSGSASC